MNEETLDPTLVSPERTHDLEVQKYLEELNRISTEIGERYSRGDYLQVMSSLAALPSLHRIILDECENASKPNPSDSLPSANKENTQEDEPSYFGLYL